MLEAAVPCSQHARRQRRPAHVAEHGDIQVWTGKLPTLSWVSMSPDGYVLLPDGELRFMSDLHLPLLGVFGAGFVLDVLWRGFHDWLDQ
ncbi:MAG TPA: hypothetical protein VMM15_31425 [Bradyrhizobium sp.]|nr:hypothetical protein [Bradyrhizobium sp.]